MTIRDLKRIPRERWPFTTVADIVRPLEQAPAVSPDMSLVQALELMTREDVNQLPVVSNGKFAGVISRGLIVQFMETKSELKAA